MQIALQPLRTPAIQSFLHLLPTMIALWALLDLRGMSLSSLKASIVSIAVAGIQVKQVQSELCLQRLLFACISSPLRGSISCTVLRAVCDMPLL